MSQQNEELQTQSEEIQALNSELGRRESLLQTLLDTARLALGEQAAMQDVCAAGMGLFGEAAAAVAVYEEQAGQLMIHAAAGLGDGHAIPQSRPAHDTFAELVIRENRTACLNDASLRPDLPMLEIPGEPPLRTVLCAPMQADGRAFGAVAIYGRQKQEWTAEQFRLAEWLADQCARILETLRMQAALRESEERRKVTEAVQAERQRFNNVLDMLPAYVVLLTPDYHVPFANRFFEERFGKSDGKRCYEYLFQRTEPCENCETYNVLKTGAPQRWEWTGPDGRNYDIHDFPFTDADGSPLIMEVGLDITDRKRAEAAVQAQRQRLFDVLETLPAMICLLTPDYHVTFANRGFRERFGESEGRRCYEYCFGKTEPCEFCESYNVLKTGQPHHWELAGPDGSVIAAHDYPFTDVDGSPMILEMDLDITEQRRAEAALKEANETLEMRVAERTAELSETAEELRRSNRELEQFAYITSHDLQEPLRQVRSFVQLLRDRHQDKLAGDALEYMKFIYDGAARMSDLVHDLLAFSRVGAKERKPQPVSCTAALQDALAGLQASLTEARAVVTHDELPTVSADPRQLTQLFQNLIGNAVKFRRDGAAPEIHVGARRDGANWLLSVRDNGIGIDPEHFERIFMVFQRLHTREKYPGTGIGLAICKKIVEQHGGRIWLESEPGRGTTFYFALPEKGVA